MEVDLNRLRQLRSQEYGPQKSAPLRSYLDEFTQKEFDQQHLAEVFHENTKYTETMGFKLGPSAGVFMRDPSFVWAQAKLSPDHPGKPRIELPDPEPLSEEYSTVVAGRRSCRDFTGEGIDIQTLSTLLQHSCGVTGSREVGDTEDEDEGEPTETQEFRAYASAGALYPVEIYFAVVNGSEELDPGVYYYAPREHSIRVIETDDEMADRIEELIVISDDVLDPRDAGIVFLLTGSFWRAMAKYGPRGYRFVLQESGHLAQNVLLASEALDIGSVPLAAFHDDKVNDCLGVNGVDEAALYAIALGHPTEEDDDE